MPLWFGDFSLALRVCGGKENFKSGAATGTAGNVNVTAALLDDPVDGRQAQPGPAIFRFGRKEGLEHTRARFCIHSDAGITNDQADIIARLDTAAVTG